MLAHDRAAIVAEARSWIGTKFVWQQSAKGQGCDCKGLIAGVARGLERPEGDSFEAHMQGEYMREVPTRALRDGLRRLFIRTDEMQPGDILLLKVRRKPQHLAFYVGNNRMVHTYIAMGKVTESPLGNGPHSWRRAIDSVWTWRG